MTTGILPLGNESVIDRWSSGDLHDMLLQLVSAWNVKVNARVVCVDFFDYI